MQRQRALRLPTQQFISQNYRAIAKFTTPAPNNYNSTATKLNYIARSNEILGSVGVGKIKAFRIV
jgi:hypothetical protein